MSTASSLKTSTVKDKCTVCVKGNDEIVGNLVLRADGRYAKCFFISFEPTAMPSILLWSTEKMLMSDMVNKFKCLVSWRAMG